MYKILSEKIGPLQHLFYRRKIRVLLDGYVASEKAALIAELAVKYAGQVRDVTLEYIPGGLSKVYCSFYLYVAVDG